MAIANSIGYPVLVRPSFVLGGRAMVIVYNEKYLRKYMTEAVEASEERPVLIDRFLEEAIELDVDCVSDGETSVIGAIMEHVELAGIHSGDSACTIPAQTLSPAVRQQVCEHTHALARELEVCGLMNIQFAVQDEQVYIIEVNPRASRTVPFVSKAIGVPLAKLATKVMLGKSLEELGFTREITPDYISVKEAVFPFNRFPKVDTLLGPEMKSTGEVMGIDESFGLAFAKAQFGVGFKLPEKGNVFLSVRDRDKEALVPIARELAQMGFTIMATRGTSRYLKIKGIDNRKVNKIREGRPHVVDYIKNGEIQLVINTSMGKKTVSDSYQIRRATLLYNIPYATTIPGARALVDGISAIRKGDWGVRNIQKYHLAQNRK